MEDFVRELSSASAFYLLYGAAGVGKTRLLHELKQRRLDNREVHFIDLAADGFGGESQIHEVVSEASMGAVLMLDHFDRAANKTRHAVFREWSVDGIDKQLNFIVACRDNDFNEFRQLSQQYRSSVQSYQLLPFNEDEVQAFLAFYLFGDDSLVSLSIARPLRRQLKQTDGVVGALIALADRERDNIRPLEHPSAAGEQRKAAYLLSALIVAGALGLGLWFLGNSPDSYPVTAGSDSPLVDNPVLESASTTGITETDNREASTPAQTTADSEPVDTAAVTATAAATRSAIAGVVEGEAVDNSTAEIATELTESPGESGSNDMATPGTVTVQPQVSPAQSESTVSEFTRLLESSRQWIASSEGALGTIQIMSLSYQQFSEPNFFNYLERLAGNGVETSQIRIFHSLVGGSEVYTVTYGQYASRRAALDSIAELPDELRVNGPIPRSLAGIADELQADTQLD